MASLVGTAGTDAGKTHAVARAVILGRQKGVDIPVDDIAASREHAKIFQQDGDWFVIDLGSRNGTKLNGKPVTRSPLSHGDLITIGNTAYRFDAPEIAAKAPAAPHAAAPAGKPAAARGPSAVERERERIRAAASSRSAQTARMRADDGSGIVIKETVLQYGRIEDKGGLLGEDLGQRGPVVKAAVAVLCLGVLSLIVWGVVKGLAKDPVEEPEAPAPAAAK